MLKGRVKGKDKSYIAKSKNPKPSAKEHPEKNDVCHHCKEVGGGGSFGKMEINLLTLLSCHYAPTIARGVVSVSRLVDMVRNVLESCNMMGFLKPTDDEFFDQCVSCLSGEMTRKTFPHRPKRATDLLGLIHIFGPLRRVSRQGNRTYVRHSSIEMNLITLPLSFWDYALETATRILYMVPTKKVGKTPYDLWYGKVPNLSYLKVWGYEDTSPSEITSEIPVEVEGFEPPQEELILVHRSVWTYRAPERLCLNVEEEEHSLGGLDEPTSYKAIMLDLESNK
ncbi:ankyrin repeat-containing protein BDA1-like protein [Tanacetum coccineum]